MLQEFPSPSGLINTAEKFFAKWNSEELPVVLTQKGHQWLVLKENWFMALFCLSPEAMTRVEVYQTRGWHPFPGLFSISEDGKAGFGGGGKKGYYSSNISGGGYAFNVSRHASFILHNHRHTFTDPKGQRKTYTVELAFVVGIESSEPGETLETVFQGLFERFHFVWVKSR